VKAAKEICSLFGIAGYENQADNGYLIYGFSKSQHSSEYIDNFIKELYESHSDGFDDGIQSFPKPDRN